MENFSIQSHQNYGLRYFLDRFLEKTYLYQKNSIIIHETERRIEMGMGSSRNNHTHCPLHGAQAPGVKFINNLLN